MTSESAPPMPHRGGGLQHGCVNVGHGQAARERAGRALGHPAAACGCGRRKGGAPPAPRLSPARRARSASRSASRPGCPPPRGPSTGGVDRVSAALGNVRTRPLSGNVCALQEDPGDPGLLVPGRSGASPEAERPAERSETGQRDHREDHPEYRRAHPEEDAAHECAQEERDNRDDRVQTEGGLPVRRACPVVRAAEAWHGPVGRALWSVEPFPGIPGLTAFNTYAVTQQLPQV